MKVNKMASPNVAAPKIKIDGEYLGNVAIYRYLGIQLDGMMTFEDAVNDTYRKANKKLFTLRRIRPYVNAYMWLI